MSNKLIEKLPPPHVFFLLGFLVSFVSAGFSLNIGFFSLSQILGKISLIWAGLFLLYGIYMALSVLMRRNRY